MSSIANTAITNITDDAAIDTINSMITNIDSITAEQSWRCAMTVAMSKKCRAAFQTRRRTLALTLIHI